MIVVHIVIGIVVFVWFILALAPFAAAMEDREE